MKFLDLEAQVDSDNKFGSEDENEHLEHEKFLDDSPFDEDISFSGEPLPSSSFTNIESRLDHVVEHIEDKYLKQSVVEGDDDLLPLEVLVLEADAWPLWRVKCTPRQEYFVLYELLMKHDLLSDKLRTAFHNPRDIGYLYLEARFLKQGPQSLQHILRGFLDVRMSSLALVSQGDVGLVVNHYHNENSVNGIQVLVVPRLGFSSSPSSSLKRKRINPCPPPQLFDLQQGSEFLELHADNLNYVKESAEERKYSKQLLQTLRMELASLGVCVRDKQDFFTVSPSNVVQ
ncbi:hypothetical protein BDP27DRAFT_1426387 [Rhodocollybia butyracea]|uniref:NGN domain-containing protein n=1 Tax=Rhodocollybia butyracea TaxID=206335 RepID=A0A9P5U2U9_9AGAR|nr:hypothetical protein BDP27DRAFT_1426387 [Rhodocollybia butyracea]